MPRRSSIKSLPSAVKATIDKAIREDRFSLDEILEAVQAEFGDNAAPSRSALHRYRSNVEEQMQAVRESREIADVWAKNLGDQPDSDIGKVVIEFLRTMSFRAGSEMLNSDDPIQLKAMSQLARLVEQTENAHRMSVAREKAVREAAVDEIEQNLDKLAKGPQRPDADTLALIRAAIRGEA